MDFTDTSCSFSANTNIQLYIVKLNIISNLPKLQEMVSKLYIEVYKFSYTVDTKYCIKKIIKNLRDIL
jgi:hypothetical protein